MQESPGICSLPIPPAIVMPSPLIEISIEVTIVRLHSYKAIKNEINIIMQSGYLCNLFFLNICSYTVVNTDFFLQFNHYGA